MKYQGTSSLMYETSQPLPPTSFTDDGELSFLSLETVSSFNPSSQTSVALLVSSPFLRGGEAASHYTLLMTWAVSDVILQCRSKSSSQHGMC